MILAPGAGRIIYQDKIIRFDKVPLVTPNGDVLIQELSFEVKLVLFVTLSDCFLFIIFFKVTFGSLPPPIFCDVSQISCGKNVTLCFLTKAI